MTCGNIKQTAIPTSINESEEKPDCNWVGRCDGDFASGRPAG